MKKIALFLLFNFGTTLCVSQPFQKTWDMTHYQLFVTPDLTTYSLTGKANLTFTPSQPIDSIWFHQKDLLVTSVFLNDSLLDFRLLSDLLIIYYPFKRTTTLTVYYSLSYPTTGIFFKPQTATTPFYNHQVWTQGQKNDNRYWFPLYDEPDDKTTSELFISIPPDLIANANGKLVSIISDTSHFSTWHFSQSKPHSSYLIAFSVGKYVTTQISTDPILQTIFTWDSTSTTKRFFHNTPKMIKRWETITGTPYPWDKYDQIYIQGFTALGMENTTITHLNDEYMMDTLWVTDVEKEGLIIHELAHQWFGDLTTSSHWEHLWLNESFATWSELDWLRFTGKTNNLILEKYNSRRAVINKEISSGKRPIVHEDGFYQNTYLKGGLILDDFREIVGEEFFFRILQKFQKDFQFQTVTTEDWIRTVNDVTKSDYTWFFNQWVINSGYPKLSVSIDKIADQRKSISITITQEQSIEENTTLFILPIDFEIRTKTSSKISTHLIKNKTTNLLFQSDEPIISIIPDPHIQLIHELIWEKPEEMILSDLSSPTFSHQLLALDYLSKLSDKHFPFLQNLISPTTHPAIVKHLLVFLKQKNKLPLDGIRNLIQSTSSEHVAIGLTFSTSVKPKTTYLPEITSFTNSTNLTLKWIALQALLEVKNQQALGILRKELRQENLPIALRTKYLKTLETHGNYSEDKHILEYYLLQKKDKESYLTAWKTYALLGKKEQSVLELWKKEVINNSEPDIIKTLLRLSSTFYRPDIISFLETWEKNETRKSLLFLVQDQLGMLGVVRIPTTK